MKLKIADDLSLPARTSQMVRGDEARMVGVFEDIGTVGRNYGIYAPTMNAKHVQAIERLRLVGAGTYDRGSSAGRDDEQAATLVSVAPDRGTDRWGVSPLDSTVRP